MTRRKPEILAPAGCMQRLKTAYAFGADAAYIGGTKFSLRKNADNFNRHEMQAACAYAHQMGRKLYVTVNVYPLQRDMHELPAYLKELDEIGVDALIISDLGVMRMAAEYTSIPLHVSTQASVLHQDAATWWKSLGAKGIVVGRELSLQECQAIRDQCDIEIESFAHGSMCTSHSGKCVISNYTAGRDSNRGGCVQTCRYVFDVHKPDSEEIEYSAPIMNSKDLMSLEMIAEFIDRGIDSVKIEGRMKSELYVATVVGAYRRAIDACWQAFESDADNTFDVVAESAEIAKMSNRQFTTGSLRYRAYAESINYKFPGYQKSHAFAGQVVDQLQDSLIVQTRYQLQRGDVCDFITPTGASVPFSLDEILDINGESCERMPPNRLMRLPMQKEIPPLSVLRLQLPEAVCT